MPTRVMLAPRRDGGETQVKEELALPSAPVIGDGVDGHARQSYLSGRGRHLVEHARVDGRVADDALPPPSRPASNCGFTSATTSAPGCEERRQRRQDVPQRDERDVDGDHEVDRLRGRSAERQAARVDAFVDDDARIVAQRQSSWPWPTSSATTRAAPRCSSTSVKPPVEAPMSSASRPVDVDAEGVERVRELEAAAADVRMIRA